MESILLKPNLDIVYVSLGPSGQYFVRAVDRLTRRAELCKCLFAQFTARASEAFQTIIHFSTYMVVLYHAWCSHPTRLVGLSLYPMRRLPVHTAAYTRPLYEQGIGCRLNLRPSTKPCNTSHLAVISVSSVPNLGAPRSSTALPSGYMRRYGPETWSAQASPIIFLLTLDTS